MGADGKAHLSVDISTQQKGQTGLHLEAQEVFSLVQLLF